jgi:hypothetical protein
LYGKTKEVVKVSLTWKGWSLGLTIFGLILVAFALIWLFAIFPIMAKMPADYENEYMFEGFIMQLNQETMSLDETPTSVERLLEATDAQDNVVLIKQDINFYHAEFGVLLEGVCTSELLGVDRTTRENVSGYGDMDRCGQFTFPSGVEKESYDFWSASAMCALPAQYIGEEQFEGLTVYNFKIGVQDVNYGTDEATGLPRLMDLLTEIKVEPISGVPVDTTTTTTIKMNLGQEQPTPVYINSMSFTDDTIAEMVDTASSARNMILWTTVYGFWIVIGLGAVLTAGGVIIAARARAD